MADRESVKKLPWSVSLGPNRSKENVRPIFWRNRPKSYISRTQDWDEFPNGRWGDSRSPAYGDIDGYGASLKYPEAECVKMWGGPKSLSDVVETFVGYLGGRVAALPWSERFVSAC